MIKKFLSKFNNKENANPATSEEDSDSIKWQMDKDMQLALKIQANEDEHYAKIVKDESYAMSIDPWALAAEEWDNVDKQNTAISDAKYVEAMVKNETVGLRYAQELQQEENRKAQQYEEMKSKQKEQEEEDYRLAMALYKRDAKRSKSRRNSMQRSRRI